MSALDSVEFIDNPDPRCACVLLLDTSGSMKGAPISALNEGLVAFQQDIREDELAQRRTEIALVTFGQGGVKVLEAQTGDLQSVQVVPAHMKLFVTGGEFQAPHLAAGDMTPMGEAIRFGIDLIRRRKDEYNQNGIAYYRPWMFLITDGEPNDDYFNAVQQLQTEVLHGHLTVFTVGVPPHANMEKLAEIAPPSRPPLMLQGLRFVELFLWLSRSQKAVSRSFVGQQQVALPPVGTWAFA